MPINKGKFATSITLEISKKDPTNNGKYAKVGEVAVYIPTLEDAGFDVEQAKDDAGKPLFEDGLPVYVEDAHNYLQYAVGAAVKAQARNRLISGTATLKEGKAISDDWNTLTAESEGVGNPAALLAVREVKALFADWAKKLNKSAGAQNLMTTLFNNKAALAVQTTENKEKIESYVTEFAGSLTEEQLVKYQRYIQSVIDATKPIEDATDF